jgi:MFS family permease
MNARGFNGASAARRPASWRVLLTDRKLLALAACAALFHFANAPMLMLLGQTLGLAHQGQSTLLMSAAIMTAQLVMIPTAALVGANAERWGRKPFFLSACFVLALRGLFFTLSGDWTWLIAAQVLDGIGSGIFEALLPLMVADLTRGTGRFNAARRVVETVQGIGSSLANASAGLIVVAAGYDAAFLALAAIALAAFAVALVFVPEAASRADRTPAPVPLDAAADAAIVPLLPYRKIA